MRKIVYIIGAGFSKGLNAPLQSELIRDIFELNEDDLDLSEKKVFQKYRFEFSDFLKTQFLLSDEQQKNIALEDIYTPLDRCIIDNLSFRNLGRNQIIEIRQKINALLVILFRKRLSITPNDNYVRNFAKYLVDIKRGKNISSDPVSVLSLNWDILLDNALKNEILENEGVVDYCCHITPYKKDENMIPGLLARGKGLFNFKLLKLHGSMNWLQCNRCQRLYITFYEKIALDEFLVKPKCRLCEKNFHNEVTSDGGALLNSQLIMPTFLKDFNNVQLKLIWQNAAVELSEASKIVFLGYSFPAADFELRQLFARSISHKAEIEVVLRNKPTNVKWYMPEYRYKNFFGERKISFYYEGVEDYIRSLCSL